MDRVAIVIINWNGRPYVGKCLDALRGQKFRDFSVILFDNASTDGSVDFIRLHFPEVRIIPLKKNLGFAGANNLALDSVVVPYTALLNNDAVPEPDWLQNLVNALDENPQAGMAASKMLFFNQRNTIDRAGDAYSRSGTGMLRGRGEPATEYSRREWVFGACAGAALYRTAMLKQIGLFDDDFFLLYEDVDLSFRAQLSGFPCIYVPDAVVFHMASASIGIDSPISVYYSQRNLEWVYCKNLPIRLVGKTLFLHLLYDLASFLFFISRGRGRIFLRAKFDALRGLSKALSKRKNIQSRKVVSDAYIWNLMTPERFYPRLRNRLKR